MHAAHHRRWVAAITALMVLLSGALALLATAPSSAAPAPAQVRTVSVAGTTTSEAAGSHRHLGPKARAKKRAERRAAARRKARAQHRAAAHRKALAQRAAAHRKAVAHAKALAKKQAKKQAKAHREALARKRAAAKRAFEKLTPRQKRVFLAQQAAARRQARERRRAAAARAARLARVKVDRPRTWIRYAPGTSGPAPGPAFNNPYGSRSAQRRLVTKVIDAINASPGYRRPLDPRTHRPAPCPALASQAPSEIKIAVYSIADRVFARALEAAQRRCVSVQVLMNSHLTAVTSPSYGIVQRALGARGKDFTTRRSFAHRCSNGCLGSSVLHSKFYLFSRSGSQRDTVITGSSNMTSNAIKVQWNDLFTIDGNERVYAQYRQMFTRMVPDRSADGPFVYPAVGRYQSTFYPFRRSTLSTDPTLKALRTIRCSGATGGTGVHGHTVVYVAMHAWFGDRGYALAKHLRTMARKGCYVRVLYSFMSRTTFRRLTWGSGPRLTARRVLFPGPYGVLAGKYSHLKLFAASGNVAGNPSAHVVWTGSTNWSSSSYRADDLMLRIAGTQYYRAYVREWHRIRHRRSSGTWAKYLEPSGGGRAP